MPYVPLECWSVFIGTYRGSDFERSASQNRTTSKVVTIRVVTFSNRTTIVMQESTSNSLSFLLLTPKVYSQSLITFKSLLVLSRDRAAWMKNGLFRQSSICSQAGFSKIQCSLHDSCLRCTSVLGTTVVRTMSMWKHRTRDWPGEYPYSPERNQHQAWRNT